MKKILLTSLLILSSSLLMNCAKQSDQFKYNPADYSSGGTKTPTDGPTDSTGGGDTSDPLAGLDFKGRVESTDTNNNALAFDFDKTRGEFIVMLPLPPGMLFSPSGSFSKMPDITFSPMFDSTGRMKFAVRIPVKYIIKGVNFLPAASLPNGDPLPAMPAGYGELPSLGLNFPAHNNTQIAIYLGVNAIGLFVTLPEKAALPIGFTVPIKNSDKSKTLGTISYVPKKGTYAPGLFLSTLVPPKMARILEDYLKL